MHNKMLEGGGELLDVSAKISPPLNVGLTSQCFKCKKVTISGCWLLVIVGIQSMMTFLHLKHSGVASHHH